MEKNIEKISKEITDVLNSNPEVFDNYIKSSAIKCTEEIHNKIIHYFAIAGTAALMFVILSSNLFTSLITEYIKNSTYVIIVKTLIMFAVVYVVDIIVENWRVENVVC